MRIHSSTGQSWKTGLWTLVWWRFRSAGRVKARPQSQENGLVLDGEVEVEAGLEQALGLVWKSVGMGMGMGICMDMVGAGIDLWREGVVSDASKVVD